MAFCTRTIGTENPVPAGPIALLGLITSVEKKASTAKRGSRGRQLDADSRPTAPLRQRPAESGTVVQGTLWEDGPIPIRRDH